MLTNLHFLKYIIHFISGALHISKLPKLKLRLLHNEYIQILLLHLLNNFVLH